MELNQKDIVRQVITDKNEGFWVIISISKTSGRGQKFQRIWAADLISVR